MEVGWLTLRTFGLFALAVLAATLGSGCLQSETPSPPTRNDDSFLLDIFPVALDHDHTLPKLHEASFGLDRSATIRSSFGSSAPGIVSRVAAAHNVLLIGLTNPASAATGTGLGVAGDTRGLLVVDVTNIDEPRARSILTFPGGGSRPIAISQDARFGFVGTEFWGVQGVWTVDLRDLGNARAVAFTPMPEGGPTTLSFFQHGARSLVLATVAHPVVPGQTYVAILGFDPGRPDAPLATLGRYVPTDGGGLNGLPDEALAQVHPLTGDVLMYVANWDRGFRIVDIKEPTDPKEVGKFVDPAPMTYLRAHTFRPFPSLVDGRLYAVATPSCYYVEPPCFVRILDVTDPTKPVQVGHWMLPGDAKMLSGAYHRTLHLTVDEAGRVYLPWAHGGLWVLDANSTDLAKTPRAIAHFFDVGERAPGLNGPTPMAQSVIVHKGRVLLSDAYTGVHVLRSDGIAPVAP